MLCDKTGDHDKMKLNSNQSIQPITTLKRYYHYILAAIMLIVPINAAANNSMQLQSRCYHYNWEKIIDKHFVVAFTKKDEKIAKTALSIVDNFHAQISPHIGGYTLNSPVSIIIAPSRQVFENLSGITEEWAVGMADKTNRIVILSPRRFGGKSEIERLLRHEYTHILLHRAAKGHFLPRWLNEGLAMHYESDVWRIPDDIRLTKAFFTHSLLPLDLLSWYFPSNREKAALAYSQSLDVVTYIIEEYGYESLKQLIREIAIGHDIDTAMLNSLGIDTHSLETEWYKSLSKRYNWFYCLNSMAILWASLPIICIIAYIRKTIQGKRKKRQWEIEDGMDIM
ncbi:MAG: peptidase MA family metallohydrolase [Candidatus Desantisbacteria bacterium]